MLNANNGQEKCFQMFLQNIRCRNKVKTANYISKSAGYTNKIYKSKIKTLTDLMFFQSETKGTTLGLFPEFDSKYVTNINAMIPTFTLEQSSKYFVD